MQFKSLQDILKFAMAKEESSVQFYRMLSARVSKSETKTIFEILAKQEEKHIEAIRLELLKEGFTVADTNISSEEEDADIHLEMDEKAGDMTFVDALRLGTQKERAAFRLYAELMALAEDPASRRVFLELAEEEMRHLIQLEHEIHVMTGPRNK